MAAAEAAGDTALARELEQDYDYDGIDTCAVDGMCQTACPVLINTGDLVKRLRAEQRRPSRAGGLEAGGRALGRRHRRRRPGADRGRQAARPASHRRPPRPRRLLGADDVPLWDADLPSGGTRRSAAAGSRRRTRSTSRPASARCSAPDADSSGVGEAFLALCERAGIRLTVPAGIDGLCCGTPWKSKGMTAGYDEMRQRVTAALREATGRGSLPVVCDASSCTGGAVSSSLDGSGLRVIDAVDFVHEQVLPRLTVTGGCRRSRCTPPAPPPGSESTRRCAPSPDAVAEEVVVPADWGCCAFAGDRGLLHPELTASATARRPRRSPGAPTPRTPRATAPASSA